MPNIYDTEEVTLDDIISGDDLFIVDTSDTTMSTSGSNKLAESDTISGSSVAATVSVSNFHMTSAYETGSVYIQFYDESNFERAEIRDEVGNTLIDPEPPYSISERTRTLVSENIDNLNLTYITIRNQDTALNSLQRFIDPKHFEFDSLIQPISLIFSNLSSLHAHLTTLYRKDDNPFAIDGLSLSEASAAAINDINSVFNRSLSDSSSNGLFDRFGPFDLGSLIRIGEFNDNQVGPAVIIDEFPDQVQAIYNTNYLIDTRYNFLVDCIKKSGPDIGTDEVRISNSDVNYHVAREIKGDASNTLMKNGNIFTQTTFINRIMMDIGKTSEADRTNVSNNYLKIAAVDIAFEKSSIDYNNFKSSYLENDIVVSTLSESNPFDEVVSFYSTSFDAYSTITYKSYTSQRSLIADHFSETQLNQKYHYETANNERMAYLSEDGRFEFVYATTGGSNPTVQSITETLEYDEDLTFSLGHYELTLSGLDYGIVYGIEFDNITTPFDNVRKIYKVANEPDENLAIELHSDTVTDIPEKYEFTLLNEGINQSATLRLQTTDWIQNTDGLTNPPFSFSNIKSLRAQRYLNDDENLNWVLRSTDVRTNFQASMSSSITNPGGGYRLNLAIDDTENLIFDIEAVRSLGDDWELFEASVVGSSETITRSYLLSELEGYQFFRINTYFAANKNRYYYPTEEQGVNPIGLESGWVNIDSSAQENVIIKQLNGEAYLKSTTKSGLFLDFEFGNLVSGSTYYEYIPEYVNFEGDSNTYLPKLDSNLQTSFERFGNVDNLATIQATGETHNILTTYDISGGFGDVDLTTGVTTTLELTGDAINFQSSGINIYIPSGTTITPPVVIPPLEVDTTTTLNLTGDAINFESPEISIYIPSGTTLT
jgi:hypothetical protein